MGERAVLLPAEGRWPNGVDVWRVAIPNAAVEYPHLDGEERARARRFLRESDRIRFAWTRSVLRELLGAYVGQQGEDVRFRAGPYGRPELALLVGPELARPVGSMGPGHAEAGQLSGGALSFNVSHAGSEALIAISRTHTVGVDIEYIKPGFEWPALVPLVCTGEEARMLNGCAATMGADQARERFFRCWTAKEAVLKTLGLGVTEGLQALDIDLGREGAQTPGVRGDARFAPAAAVTFHWVRDIGGYVGCVCSGPAGLAEGSPQWPAH